MTPHTMNASAQFNALVHSLGQQWGIPVTTPALDHTVRFGSKENNVVMLRLDDDEKRVVLGIECLLPGHCSGALDTREMGIFMLRRNYAARFGSRTRYGWRGTRDRIAAFQSVPLEHADVESISASLAAISARLNAMRDIATLFTSLKHTVPTAADRRNSRHV